MSQLEQQQVEHGSVKATAGEHGSVRAIAVGAWVSRSNYGIEGSDIGHQRLSCRIGV